MSPWGPPGLEVGVRHCAQGSAGAQRATAPTGCSATAPTGPPRLSGGVQRRPPGPAGARREGSSTAPGSTARPAVLEGRGLLPCPKAHWGSKGGSAFAPGGTLRLAGAVHCRALVPARSGRWKSTATPWGLPDSPVGVHCCDYGPTGTCRWDSAAGPGNYQGSGVGQQPRPGTCWVLQRGSTTVPGCALRVTGDGVLLHPGARWGLQEGFTAVSRGPPGLTVGVHHRTLGPTGT